MSDNKAIQRFFGYILIAVGGLITLLSGGCTVAWLGFFAWNTGRAIIAGSIFNPVNVNAFAAAFGLTLIVGGLPIAIGVVLVGGVRRSSWGRSNHLCAPRQKTGGRILSKRVISTSSLMRVKTSARPLIGQKGAAPIPPPNGLTSISQRGWSRGSMRRRSI
jgi:hypothetical protein